VTASLLPAARRRYGRISGKSPLRWWAHNQWVCALEVGWAQAHAPARAFTWDR